MLKLIDLHTKDKMMIYEETVYHPPVGIIGIYEDILFLADSWVEENGEEHFDIELYRNLEGYPTVEVRDNEEVVCKLGVVKSNSNPFQMERIDI